MREFWKGNKWIVIFLGMALAYSICYFVVSDKETILSMLYAVALSYIAAFIFYLLQVYFPEKEKTKSIKNIIKSRLANITSKVDELYTELFKLYIPNYNNTIDINKHMKNLLKYDFNDYTEIGDVKKIYSNSNKQNVHKTVKDVTAETILTFEKNMDYLYTTFPNYLSSEVIDVLEKMRSSLFKQVITFQIVNSVNPNFSNSQENIFEEFWNLNRKLKKYKDGIN